MPFDLLTLFEETKAALTRMKETKVPRKHLQSGFFHCVPRMCPEQVTGSTERMPLSGMPSGY